MNKIWTIGDIHGELKFLQKLLGKLFREEGLDLSKDKLVFTGDYVDRGKYSFEVLRILRRLKTKYPKNVIVLLGNHEEMMINALTKPHDDHMYLWKINGGTKAIKSFYKNFNNKTLPLDWLRWVAKLPIQYLTENFIFTHAPICDYNDLILYNRSRLLWHHIPNMSGEEHVTSWAKKEGKVGICGHVHRLHNGVNTPRLYDHYIFNDSGCGCGSEGRLSAVEVKSRTVITIGREDL